MRQTEQRIHFYGKRKTQTNAHNYYIERVVYGDTKEEAILKLEETFEIQEVV